MIKALRSTANRIETDQEYQWSSASNCNCGMLLQELTGDRMYSRKVWRDLDGVVACARDKSYRSGDQEAIQSGFWYALKYLTEQITPAIFNNEELPVCSHTGKTVRQIIDELRSFGFDDSDWADIEYTGCGRYGTPSLEKPFQDRSYIAAFMRKRADELEARWKDKAKARLERMKSRKHIPSMATSTTEPEKVCQTA